MPKDDTKDQKKPKPFHERGNAEAAPEEKQQEKPQANEIPKGTIIFKEGETTQDLYVVQEGTVKIYKTSEDGKQLPLGTILSGQFFGELAFFDGEPRSATAEAATDIKLIKIEKDKLDKEFSKLPSWMIVLIKSIAQRVRSAGDLVKRNTIIDKEVEEEFKKF